MKKTLEQTISQAIQQLYGVQKDVILTKPPAKEMGDFATNIALSIAKEVHKAPIQIAEEIRTALQDNKDITDIVIAGPGFINLYVNTHNFVAQIVSEASQMQKGYFVTKEHEGKHMSVEHTAANPNKHLHIGHLRNFSIGDTLVRLFSASGYEVSVQYIYNDQGLQVAKAMWGFMNLDKIGLSELTQTIEKGEEKFDAIAAKVYVTAEKFLSAHEEEYADEIRNIIMKMEEGGNDISAFSEETTVKILLGQVQTIAKFLVYYDQLITETSMTQSGELNKVLNKLLETGKVYKETEGKNNGCIVIKGLKDENGNIMPDKVLLRADGTALYTAKDIVLALWKFGLLGVQFNFRELIRQFNEVPMYISTVHNGKEIHEDALFHINVVDQRQSFAMDVVKESLRVLGYPEQADRYHHLAYETVTLSFDTAQMLGIDTTGLGGKFVAMSGRKGIEVTIDNLLEQMTKQVLEKNQTKEDKLTYEEAESIAAGALRYYMIKFGYNTIIIFDMKEALRADGDSGIYLMYSYVRAKKILQKAGSVDAIPDISTMELPESAVDLVTEISFARDVIASAAKDFEINKIAAYAFNLAKAFTAFYQHVSVINEQDETKKHFYIALVSAYINVYSQLLDILGIHKPEKM